MPFAMSEVDAPWLASGGNTRTTISGEAKARPATPTPLFVAAPAMPETCVPWPSSSVGIPAEQLPPRHVALSVETRPARSSCVASTPVSTTASGTACAGENIPGKTDQPATAEIAGSAHCDGYPGSSGSETSRRWKTWFGSA